MASHSPPSEFYACRTFEVYSVFHSPITNPSSDTSCAIAKTVQQLVIALNRFDSGTKEQCPRHPPSTRRFPEASICILSMEPVVTRIKTLRPLSVPESYTKHFTSPHPSSNQCCHDGCDAPVFASSCEDVFSSQLRLPDAVSLP